MEKSKREGNMITFSNLTRIEIYKRDNGKCINCGESEYWKLEIHHIIANTKLNRKLYGNFIQSKDNGVIVCKNCHFKHSLWDRDLREKIKMYLKDKQRSKMSKFA